MKDVIRLLGLTVALGRSPQPIFLRADLADPLASRLQATWSRPSLGQVYDLPTHPVGPEIPTPAPATATPASPDWGGRRVFLPWVGH